MSQLFFETVGDDFSVGSCFRKIDIDNGVGKKDFSKSKSTFNDRVSYMPEGAS